MAQATMGTLAQGQKTGAAVKTIKLLAQSTGEFTREELKKDVKFGWTDKAKAEIAAAKGETANAPANNGGGSGSQNQGGSNSGNSGSSETVATPSIIGNTSFQTSTQVSMSGPDGAEIRYTTDGSVPTNASTLYSTPFTLTETTVVKAIAIKNGVSSEVTIKSFTKNTSGDDAE